MALWQVGVGKVSGAGTPHSSNGRRPTPRADVSASRFSAPEIHVPRVDFSRLPKIEAEKSAEKSKPAPSAAAANKVPAAATKPHRYIAGVDGLRALAVIAVLAYHLNLPWAQGGIVGVTVFFVISGYLITGNIRRELDESDTLNIKRFWVRRLRRLMPACILVLVVTALLGFFFNQGLLYKLKGDVLPALLWFTNWWYIFRQQSYFETALSPSPLTHFWSLAIEEQFYLVWPLVLLGLHKAGTKRQGMRRVTLGLAVASVLAMALLYSPTADPSRVYYGTDTRAFSLLIGAALALWGPSDKVGEKIFSLSKVALEGVGIAGLVGIVVMAVLVSGTSSFWYWGGLALASVCSAAVIAAVAHPDSKLGAALACKPLAWLGTRSYGIYLWHYPLLLLMNPSQATKPGVLQIVLELVVVVAAAELSYRFVEEPLRHGLIGKTWKAWRAGELEGARLNRARIATGATVVILVATCLVTAFAQSPNQGLLSQEDIAAGTSEGTIVSDRVATDAPADDTDDADSADATDGSSDAAAATGDAADATPDEEPVVTGYEPLMIGDSVSIGLTDVFHQAYTGGLIDACGNRQLAMGQQVYDYYRDRGEVGSNVILALGTNGSFDAEELEAFLADIGDDKNVWIVTNRVPSSWGRTTNQTINEVAANHSNVQVIDWEAYSEGHDEWLSTDGIHLSAAGRVAYMQMIVDAIGSNKMIEAATAKANEAAGGAWIAPEDGSMSQEMHDALLLGMTPAARISRETTGELAP